MALNTIIAGRAWLYSHNIGRNSGAGMGFSQPVGVVSTKDGTLYVANRSGEQAPSTRISKCTIDQEFITEFGRKGPVYGGNDNVQIFTWITGVAVDKDENVYGSDEWKSQVSVFDKEGEYLKTWGEKGDGEGQLNGAAGICFDVDDNIWVVNSFNSRVQKFTKDGQFLSGFGKKGDLEGQMEMPSGLSLDAEGNLYVTDWGNNRVLKFTPEGQHLLTFGHGGTGAGSLNHPTGVCIDNDGDVYVVDWMNERVVIYDKEARPLTYLYGDAVEVSAWGNMSLEANPDMVKRRNQVSDLVDQQRKFRMPMGCYFDRDNNRLIVVDTNRARLQIYVKDYNYQDPQFNL
jgi:DNA-binding beta-propeller fold protein YncE